MTAMVLKAPAKINLGLSILRKLNTGYHEVKTIYSQVSLFDVLIINELKEDKIEIFSDKKDLPLGKENLVYQAIDLIKKTTNTKKGLRINLQKRIPMGSGLGGGSSDAAAVLQAANQLWALKLPLPQLIKLAEKIGADVAYHLVGGIQLETQGGNKAGSFSFLRKKLPGNILICFPDIKIESSQAYSEVEYAKINQNNLLFLIKAIKNKDLSIIARGLHNDFEEWTLKKYPVIKKIKKEMLGDGALGSLMSGKGSAVFGLFQEKKKAAEAYKKLRKRFLNTFLVESL